MRAKLYKVWQTAQNEKTGGRGKVWLAAPAGSVERMDEKQPSQGMWPFWGPCQGTWVVTGWTWPSLADFTLICKMLLGAAFTKTHSMLPLCWVR